MFLSPLTLVAVIYDLQIIGNIFYKVFINSKKRIVKKEKGPKNKPPLYAVE